MPICFPKNDPAVLSPLIIGVSIGDLANVVAVASASSVPAVAAALEAVTAFQIEGAFAAA